MSAAGHLRVAPPTPTPLDVVEEAVSLEVGSPYVFYSPGKREHGWHYVCKGVGVHAHSHQEQVAYVGLDHGDRGRMYFAPLLDWHTKFRLATKPAEPKPEPAPEPGSVLDYRTTGNPH